MMNEIKLAFSKGMQKKGQMGGLAGGAIAIAIAGVVGIIMISVYNGVFNNQIPRLKNTTSCGLSGADSNVSCINGTTRTVFENIPVFIGILVLLGAVGGFIVGRK
jgi:hypothetical protein